MKFSNGFHLAYCSNIHRGEDWPETFDALQRYTVAVRERVCPGRPYAIGLRLSDLASRQLSEPATLTRFQRWLEEHACYVFTINGFPFGQFHGTRVKERVYAPDWTSEERLAYTNRLFDLLAKLLPPGVEGSVSTVPGSFKEFIRSPEQAGAMRKNLWRCVEYIGEVSERTGKILHLGLEPEPLCYLETSAETVAFFEQLRDDRPNDARLARHLGVTYDACHLAVEFETPQAVVQRFREHGVRIRKIHLSSALKVCPRPEVRRALAGFADDTYLHQVIARGPEGKLTRFRDLAEALAEPAGDAVESTEWRIHFHVPLHWRPAGEFESTAEHLLGLLELLAVDPGLCSHLEMETYTWEVMPPELRQRSVVEQLVAESRWTLEQLAQRGVRQG